MGVYDDIFPQAGGLEHVQTKWSGGWQAASSGFSYAAKFITEHRDSFGNLIDQAGLAIFVLQRHRVELALKALLNYLGATVPTNHDLLALWQACESELANSVEWPTFAKQRETVAAIAKVDQTSTAFRYPEDKQGNVVARPPYIDLGALDEYVSGFEAEVFAFIDVLEEGRQAMRDMAE